MTPAASSDYGGDRPRPQADYWPATPAPQCDYGGDHVLRRTPTTEYAAETTVIVTTAAPATTAAAASYAMEVEEMDADAEEPADAWRFRSRYQCNYQCVYSARAFGIRPASVGHERSGTTSSHDSCRLSQDRTSTFSLDTDRTSFQLALNWARAGFEVDPDSVRAEEWINAFNYGYQHPTHLDSFEIITDLVRHPARRPQAPGPDRIPGAGLPGRSAAQRDPCAGCIGFDA